MKLGTETGSVINHLHSRATIGQPKPAVGMGATLLGWTDRHAATICETVTNGAKLLRIGVRRDIATRTDQNGMSEDQSYTFAYDPQAHVEHFRMGRNGRWESIHFNKHTNRWNKRDGGYGLRIGERDEYHDFTF